MDFPISETKKKRVEPKVKKPGYLNANSTRLKVRLDNKGKHVILPVSVNEDRKLTTLYDPKTNKVLGVVRELHRTKVEAHARLIINLHRDLKELPKRFVSLNLTDLLNIEDLKIKDLGKES